MFCLLPFVSFRKSFHDSISLARISSFRIVAYYVPIIGHFLWQYFDKYIWYTYRMKGSEQLGFSVCIFDWLFSYAHLDFWWDNLGAQNYVKLLTSCSYLSIMILYNVLGDRPVPEKDFAVNFEDSFGSIPWPLWWSSRRLIVRHSKGEMSHVPITPSPVIVKWNYGSNFYIISLMVNI